MGADSSDISQSQFRKFWRQGESLQHLVVWQNKDNPAFQLEQYSLGPQDSPRHDQLYQLRRKCPYLVAAYALREDSLVCGGSRDWRTSADNPENIFIERMRLRLSNITDLPYPDILHLYDAALQGFALLAEVVGWFRVDEDQIAVNDQGQVKVWLSPAFESSRVLTQNVTEQIMLQDIFQILEGVSDQSTYPPGQPTLAQYLTSSPSSQQQETPALTFSLCKARFFTYIRQFCGSQIPTSLSCVLETGGTEAINNWCRQNGSFGFERSSLRLTEKVLQSKMNRLSSGWKSNSQLGQDSQIVRDSLPVNLETSQIPQEEAPHEQAFIVGNQQVHYELPEITRQAMGLLPVQTATNPSTTQNIPPAEGEQLRNGSRALQPVPSQPIYIPIEPQRVIQQQIVGLPQPQFIPRQVIQSLPPNPQLISVPSQKFITVIPTRIVSQPPQVPTFPLPEGIQQTESRLQQQRVISQTIQIKDSAKPQEDYKLTTDYNYLTHYNPNSEYNRHTSGSGSLDWHDYTKKDEPKDAYLETYGRRVPNSYNVGEKRYDVEEDGKSSPEFLALMNELRSGTGKSRLNEVYCSSQSRYSQAAGSPLSFPRESSSHGSKKKLNYDGYSNDIYGGQAFSSSYLHSKDLEGGKMKYESGSYSYLPESYSYKRYETVLDPELQADLLRYK